MRRAACAAVLAAFMAAIVAAETPQGKPGAPGACTGVKEKRDYCSKCDKILKKDEVKAGKCTTCETSAVKVDICIKTSYVPKCHPEKASAKPTT